MHAEHESIDGALLREESYRNIAEHFGVSPAALSRHHASGHVSQAMARAHQAEEIAAADRLLLELDGILLAAKRILATGEADGNPVSP